jgi:hypothetical protein
MEIQKRKALLSKKRLATCVEIKTQSLCLVTLNTNIHVLNIQTVFN